MAMCNLQYSWFLAILFALSTMADINPKFPPLNLTRQISTGATLPCRIANTLGQHQTIQVTSPLYPYSFPDNTDCAWLFMTEPGAHFKYQCNDIQMEQSPNCARDVFNISPSGGTQQNDLIPICTNGPLSGESTSNSLLFQFRSSTRSVSTIVRRFQCQVNAQPKPAVTANALCQCGISTAPRIVGGYPSKLLEFPWLVRLHFDSDTFATAKCGGAILSDRWVVTAAHCFIEPDVINNPTALIVYVGQYDLTMAQNEITKNQLMKFAIEQVIMHPGFGAAQNNHLQNDIALVRLRTAISFDAFIRPICLPYKFRTYDFGGHQATVAGWGDLFFNRSIFPHIVFKADLPILTTAECMSYIPVNQNAICTYQPGKDACTGDSGGPLVYLDPLTQRYFLIGIVSYGQSCGADKYPGVYTRVTEYLDWIDATTGVVTCRL